MKTKKLIITILSIAVVALIVIALILAMRGETKTIGDYPEDVEGESLVCESHSIKYPFFANNDGRSRHLKIVANFYDKELSALLLTYTLFYDDESQITDSEAQNHASMNISFAENGLSADAFSINYSKMSDSLKTILYVNRVDFNTTSARYFMIDVKEKKDLPDTIKEFNKTYNSQGFSCSITK